MMMDNAVWTPESRNISSNHRISWSLVLVDSIRVVFFCNKRGPLRLHLLFFSVALLSCWSFGFLVGFCFPFCYFSHFFSILLRVFIHFYSWVQLQWLPNGQCLPVLRFLICLTWAPYSSTSLVRSLLFIEKEKRINWIQRR